MFWFSLRHRQALCLLVSGINFPRLLSIDQLSYWSSTYFWSFPKGNGFPFLLPFWATVGFPHWPHGESIGCPSPSRYSLFFFPQIGETGERAQGGPVLLPRRLLFSWPSPAHFLEIPTSHFCAIMIKSVEESLKRVGTPSSSKLHKLSPPFTELPQIHQIF